MDGEKRRGFLDNGLGPITMGLVAIGMLWTAWRGIPPARWEVLIVLLGRTLFTMLPALGMLLTARGGMANFSAAPIGSLLVRILVVMDFSPAAWAVALGLFAGLTLLFALMQTRWSFPVTLLAPMIYAVCSGVLMIMTSGRSIPLQGEAMVMLGRGFILDAPLSLVITLGCCLLVMLLFRFTPLGISVKLRRMGAALPALAGLSMGKERASLGWALCSQGFCLLFGVLYALMAGARVSVFSPELSYDFWELVILLAFCGCSLGMDSGPVGVLLVLAGHLLHTLWGIGWQSMGFSPYLQLMILIGLAIGCLFLNRLYRVKGYLAMGGMAMVGLGGIPAIAAGIYQKKAGAGWGEWPG